MQSAAKTAAITYLILLTLAPGVLGLQYLILDQLQSNGFHSQTPKYVPQRGFGSKTKPTKEHLILQKSARREGLDLGHFLTAELWGLISNTTIVGMAT